MTRYQEADAMKKKMTNARKDMQKIEQMLLDAQKSLPTTNLEWRVSDMTEQKKETKNILF